MIKPLHNRVILEEDAGSDVSEGGIQLVSANRPLTGTVVAVGPGRHLDNGEFVPNAVAVGDKVVYVKGAGEEIELDGKVYRSLLDDHVIGIIS